MPKAEAGVRRAERIRESANTSRRTLFEAAGAALLASAMPAAEAGAVALEPRAGPPVPIGRISEEALALAADPALPLARSWLAADREVERLRRRWAQTETRLLDDVRWSNLSRDERRALPEAQALDEIDARMDALWDENARRLRRLARVPAKTLDSVKSKLAIVARTVEPDHLAYRLIVSIERDLRAIMSAASAI